MKAAAAPAMPPVHTPASRASDPESSYAAEDRVTRSGKRYEQQLQIAAAVARTPGMTGAQIAAVTGIDYYDVMRRISEVCTAKQAMEGPIVLCEIRRTMCRTWYPHP